MNLTIVALVLGIGVGWFAHKAYVRFLWDSISKMRRAARGRRRSTRRRHA